MRGAWILTCALGSISVAHADQCENVIALSKTSSITVASKDKLETKAAKFCFEYSKHKQDSQSLSGDVNYKFLSTSLGSTNASVEDVANKYCADSDSSQRASDAYQQYVEEIAPGAFSAYDTCIKLTQADIRFNLSPQAIGPKDLFLDISYRGRNESDKSADINVDYSGDVKCRWNERSKSGLKELDGKQIVLKQNNTGILKCTRDNPSEKSVVYIVRSDGIDGQLVIPWKAFDKEGNPVDSLAALQASLNSLRRKVTELTDEVVIVRKNSKNVQVGSNKCPPKVGQLPRDLPMRGAKTIPIHVTFPMPFDNIPVVAVAFKGAELYFNSEVPVKMGEVSRTALTYEFGADNITRQGFDINVTGGSITNIPECDFSWVAVSAN